MEAQNRKNPWLGLESYKEGEVIYGRDNDIRALAQCVLSNSSTLFYGKSGIGKSSILNAGILPAARRNEYLPVIIRLSHKAEDATYLQQIKNAIDAAGVKTKEIVTVKDAKKESFWEYFHRHSFLDNDGKQQKLLIIFDQFEEIFTLQEELQKKKDFFNNLTDLLNDVMPDDLQPAEVESQSVSEKVEVGKDVDLESIWDDFQLTDIDLPKYVEDNDIHFVFTLREDFLSEFEYFAAAIPSLKQNRYGLRPLNEEQAAQIIMRPIPEMVDKDVAKLIIEKVTKRTDFELDGVPEIEVDSAMLSLYLNRLYDAKVDDKITAKLVEEKDGEIIADFYNDALSEISPQSIDYLEKQLLTGQGCRNNVAVSDVISIGKVSHEELISLCEQKRILRKFYYGGELRVELVHDRLCSVVAQNKQLRLEHAEKEAEQAKIAEQRKKLRESRRWLWVAVSVIMLLIGGAYGYYLWYHKPISHIFGSTTKVWGRYVGVEPLSEDVARHRDNYMVLHKKGYGTKLYSSMESRNKYGELSTSHGLHPYVANQSYLDSVSDTEKRKILSVCRWEFVSDPSNDTIIIQERMFDKDNNLVYALNYSPRISSYGSYSCAKNSKNDDNISQGAAPTEFMTSLKTVIGTYVDAQGLPYEILNDGYRFVKITRDSKGRDMLIEYYDYAGNPSTNSDNAFQQYREYDDLGQLTAMYSLNAFGRRMIDAYGNCGQIFRYDGYRMVECVNVDQYGQEIDIDGHARVTMDYDDFGRQTTIQYWNKYNNQGHDKEGYSKYTIIFDDLNNGAILSAYNTGDNEIVKLSSIYDSKGNLLERKRYANGEMTDSIKCEYENGVMISNIEITKNDEGKIIGEFSYIRENCARDSGYTELRRFEGDIYNEYINTTTYDSEGRMIEDTYYEVDGTTPYENDQVWHKIEKKYFFNTLVDSTHVDYYKGDSTIYYHKDARYAAVVNQYWPYKMQRAQRVYNNDSTAFTLTNEEFWLTDEYGCVEALIDKEEDLSVVQINEKKHETSFNNRWRYLKRYKSPSFRILTLEEDPKRWKYLCDENGNKKAIVVEKLVHGDIWQNAEGNNVYVDTTSVSEQYYWENLPVVVLTDYEQMQNFELGMYNAYYRNCNCVFLETIADGRRWHYLVFTSFDDDDNYSAAKLSNSNKELECLNLITMKVESICPKNLPHEFYEVPITEEEWEKYKVHYDKHKTWWLYKIFERF